MTLFEGKDFDFDNTEARSLGHSSVTHARQETNLKQAQTAIDSGIQIKDAQNNTVLSIDQGYMLNSEKLGNSIDQSFSRRRILSRKQNSYLMIQIMDFIVSRRHFPDKTFLQELNKNPKKIPTLGMKRKTFAVSVRNF